MVSLCGKVYSNKIKIVYIYFWLIIFFRFSLIVYCILRYIYATLGKSEYNFQC